MKRRAIERALATTYDPEEVLGWIILLDALRYLHDALCHSIRSSRSDLQNLRPLDGC